jgi:hypothetical protein
LVGRIVPNPVLELDTFWDNAPKSGLRSNDDEDLEMIAALSNTPRPGRGAYMQQAEMPAEIGALLSCQPTFRTSRATFTL